VKLSADIAKTSEIARGEFCFQFLRRVEREGKITDDLIKECECPRLVAAFLSGHVLNTLVADPVLENFGLYGLEGLESEFDEFIALAHGEFVTLTASNWEKFLRIADTVRNPQLVDSIFGFLQEICPVALDNAIPRLKWSRQFSDRIPIDPVVEFIASHFHQFRPEDLGKIDVDHLEMIVSNESLCISSEDSLLDFLCHLGPEYHMLLNYLRCDYLTMTSLGRSFKLVDESVLRHDFFAQLWRRLENSPGIRPAQMRPRHLDVPPVLRYNTRR
jgi:hypothetical protein